MSANREVFAKIFLGNIYNALTSFSPNFSRLFYSSLKFFSAECFPCTDYDHLVFRTFMKSWRTILRTVQYQFAVGTMECLRLLDGLLALSVLVVCNHASTVAVNVTGVDLVQEISDTLCALNLPTLFNHIFHHCAQDGVPASKCGEYYIYLWYSINVIVHFKVAWFL